MGEGGAKTKYGYNIAAIRTLKTIEAEGRTATPEEQETLSRYVGWGGIPQAFDPDNTAWSKEYAELVGALTAEEYEMARASTLNAHYTSPTVIKAIYEAVGNMGFQTGNILEPACGVGNFFGLLPEEHGGSPGSTAWSWTASRAGSPNSFIRMPTSPWRALKPPTGKTFSTLPWATCRSAAIRFPTGPTTSSVFRSTITSLPKRSIRCVRAA